MCLRWTVANHRRRHTRVRLMQGIGRVPAESNVGPALLKHDQKDELVPKDG